MSLLANDNSKPPSCACQNNASTGHFALRVEPRVRDLRDGATHDESLQLEQSGRIQSLYLPNMESVPVHQHGTGFHAHPAIAAPGTLAHLESLHDILDEHGLVARVQVTPSAEDTAVAVALTRENVSELLTNGLVDLNVPTHDTTIRLHSTLEGRITAAEYVQ